MSWGFAVGSALKPRCGWKLSPAQRDEAARRYAAGERVTDLAKEFNVSKPSIIHLAKARGVHPHDARRHRALKNARKKTARKNNLQR